MSVHGARLGLAGVLLTATMLLAGCAHMVIPAQSDGLSFTQRRALLKTAKDWSMDGRLAVRTGKRGFQGSYTWQQAGEDLKLTIRGPLGFGAINVAGSPAQLVVHAKGKTHVLESPEADLSRLLGWWMPVESLPYWLRGIPDPGFKSRHNLNPELSVISSLDQRQWHLDYNAYQLAHGLLMPRRIVMTHGPLRITLLIDSWTPAHTLSNRAPGSGT